MKALIIYHANCNDGFGAAWVAWNALIKKGYECELFPAMYGQEPPYEKLNNMTTVFIVDFSYPADQIIKIAGMCSYLTVIDHHKTAKEEFDKLNSRFDYEHGIEIVFDISRSGAMLTWNYFNPGVTSPKLIQHIEDRDLWKFKLKDTRAVHMYLSTTPQTIEEWDYVSEMLRLNPESIYSQGNAILRYYDATIQHIIGATKTKILIDGQEGLCCNAPHMFASDIGNILAKESGTFGVTWYENGNKDTCFSIRSIGDFDVAEVAKRFGGGGHKNAAGFKLSVAETEYMDERSYPGITLWSIPPAKENNS